MRVSFFITNKLHYILFHCSNVFFYSIDEKLHVKITDNCLSRDLFPNDYFCLGDNESRPVKWLALESLLHKQYTGASDVVSFDNDKKNLNTLLAKIYQNKTNVNNCHTHC